MIPNDYETVAGLFAALNRGEDLTSAQQQFLEQSGYGDHVAIIGRQLQAGSPIERLQVADAESHER